MRNLTTHLALLMLLAICAQATASEFKSSSTHIDNWLQIKDNGLTGVNISADFSGLITANSSSQKSIFKIDDEERIGLPGYPDVPSISRLFIIPPTGKCELSYQTDDAYSIKDAEFEIFPAVDAEGNEVRSANPLFTNSNRLWPEQIVTIDEPVIMRGVRMVRMSIHPVQIDPTNGEMVIHNNLEISLNFTDGSASNEVSNPNRHRLSGSAIRSMKSIVSNPELLRDDVKEKGAFAYVIPNYNGVAEAIQPLVTMRKMQGYPTRVITVAANASNVDVKNALQDAYDNWEIPPEIICLVGEADLQSADFMIPTWDVGRAYMWETDYKYGLLEGQDMLPEAAVGRISTRSLNELRSIVAKIIGYEMNPALQDTAWFTKGAVMANDERTGYSSIYLQRWARKLMMEVGFTEVDTFYFIHQNEESDHNFIRRTINQGISVFNYRGWGQFNGAWAVGNSGELRNNQKLPLMILPTCNTGDFADHILAPHAYAEDFLWAQNGGAIGTIGSSGFTHTNYNNVIDGGILNSFYRDDVWSIGWALNRGKLELYRHFGQFNDVQDPQVQNLLVWEAHCYQFNLIGDPGTELWTGVPQRMSLTTEDTLLVGSQNIAIELTEPGTDTPIPEASVTLLQDGEIIRHGWTDIAGRVLFTFAPDELSEDNQLILSATQHDRVPSIDTLTVLRAPRFLAARTIIVDDDNAGRSHGNGDRIPNPGETIELRTYIANYGAEAIDGSVDIALSRNEGDYRVTAGNVHLNQAPAAGDSVVATFVVEVGNLVENNERLVFNLTTAYDNQFYNSTISLTAGSFDLSYAHHRFTPDPFRPGDTAWVDITVRNIGALTSPEFTGRLISLNPIVSVFSPQANFAAVSVARNDSLATGRFRLYAHNLTVPGTRGELLLTFESEAGMRDTTRFSYTISAPAADTPFGPDSYGYVCFDNTDTRWDVAPEYNWIEIDTALGGEGQNTDIRDRGNEQDWSVLVDLPFPTKYYGQEFDQITICSNGWFAFGDESKLADFQNRRIPPALGPRAQVCVFWDDLINLMDENNSQIGGVFYKFDEENHQFIVEWSRMRRYIGMENNAILEGSEESFQAIIYDPQHYPTYTGDGDIVFQYRDVSNDQDVDPNEFDTPFATVGIVNLNGTDGLEYTYWNRYTPGAAALVDGRAIKFSTKLIVVVGAARGTVVDAATNQPIPNAEIRGSRGSFALTNRSGQFTLGNVLIGEDYSFTAWAPGYNDSTLSGFDIAENDTVELSFSLLHPTFSISHEEIAEAIRPDFGADVHLVLQNEGNGSLDFTSKLTYPGVVGEGNWPRMLNIDASGITYDNRLQSAVFFNDKMWIAGSFNSSNPNRFYLFDDEGAMRGFTNQPGTSSYGIRGTTADGEYLYGGEGTWIYKINSEAQLVDSLRGPFALQRALAYDSHDDNLWVANGRDDPIVQIDWDGNIIRSFDHELEVNGLAFFPDDPDGFPLYILSRDRTNPGLQIPEALITKLNPETGEMRVITVLDGTVEDRGGEIEITSDLNTRKWILIAMMTSPAGTRVSTFDMGPNTTWLSYTPRIGYLTPGTETPINVRLDATNLEEGEYNLILRFLHNAAGLRTDIPVRLTVDQEAFAGDNQVVPFKFYLQSAYPNPFNSTTVIRYSLAEHGAARLGLYDLSGRLIRVLMEGDLEAGNHSIDFAGEDLASGMYIVRLESLGSSRSIKIALIR